MTLGELYLGTLSSGVITPEEIDWLLQRQSRLSRQEQATAQRLGRLIDAGSIQLGCRLPAREPDRPVHDDWIEPLGRRRHRRRS